ncbi:hypothetical protein TNCV_591971 [Trichonephila clavipes]|nr:hypothetical protein TNCV_591971 [Trichonephila clavipes]
MQIMIEYWVANIESLRSTVVEGKSNFMLFMDASISEQCVGVWFVTAEYELNASNYKRMRSVYSEHCFGRTSSAKGFMKGLKRYHIFMTMPAQTSLLKASLTTLKQFVAKCWNTHRTVQICFPEHFFHFREHYVSIRMMR